MKIGELATRTGLATSAIRYYERIGLLPPARRASNGYREFGEDTVQRLRILALSQSFGLSLDSLRSAFVEPQGFVKGEMLSLLDERLGEIDLLLRMLKTQKRELGKVRDTLQRNWAAGRCVDPETLDRRHTTALVQRPTP